MTDKTKAQLIREYYEQGMAMENVVRSEFDRAIPHNYSEQQAHGGNRFDFALEDSGGDRCAVVEVKSGGWHDKAQVEGFVALAEDTRAKLLITVGDKDKFDKGVLDTLDSAERDGRITHINVPPEQMDKFADLSKKITEKVDATANRDCPEVGKEFKATWANIQNAEPKQATIFAESHSSQVTPRFSSSSQSQQPGMAFSQARYNPAPSQQASSVPASQTSQPGMAFSNHQANQVAPPNPTSHGTGAQTSPMAPPGMIKFK